MPLQKDFLKDEPQDASTEAKNTILSQTLASAPYLQKRIVLIERVEEGETGWSIYFHS
jgi:hypothetical protein